MTGLGLPPRMQRQGFSPGTVLLSCKAEVAGEELEAYQVIDRRVYNDPVAREAVEAALRHKLVFAILEKWTPVIRVTE